MYWAKSAKRQNRKQTNWYWLPSRSGLGKILSNIATVLWILALFLRFWEQTNWNIGIIWSTLSTTWHRNKGDSLSKTRRTRMKRANLWLDIFFKIKIRIASSLICIVVNQTIDQDKPEEKYPEFKQEQKRHSWLSQLPFPAAGNLQTFCRQFQSFCGQFSDNLHTDEMWISFNKNSENRKLCLHLNAQGVDKSQLKWKVF